MKNATQVLIVTRGTATLEVDGKTEVLGAGTNESVVIEGGSHRILEQSPDFDCTVIQTDSHPH